MDFLQKFRWCIGKDLVHDPRRHFGYDHDAANFFEALEFLPAIITGCQVLLKPGRQNHQLQGIGCEKWVEVLPCHEEDAQNR